MGIMKKFAGIFMGDDIDDEEINEEIAEGTDETQTDEESDNKSAAAPAPAPKSVELKVVRLTTYDPSVTRVADHLLKKRTVVLILDGVDRESLRRTIDFLTGVVYSIKGNLKLVSGGTYIITPSNVDVSSEQIEEATKSQQSDDKYPLESSIEEF